MAKAIKIGDRWVGDGQPCYIIAEAGSNHNGSMAQAKKLIDIAVKAGVDAVKFQLFRASKLYPREAGESDYLKLDRSIFDIIAEMEMPYEWLPDLAEYCDKNRVHFLASVFDEESVERLDPFVSAFKIASYEMTHHPLVRYIAQKGKPVIISTGTANMDEIRDTVEVFLQTGNQDLVLMQCTASYPAPLESLNLRAIPTIKDEFKVPVGFSDHSRDPVVGPLTGVSQGADVIEKHYTLSNQLPGPDHSFALEPSELNTMVQKIREVEQALGNAEKTVHPVEAELRGFARRTVFAVEDIAHGKAFTKNNVAVLRSGKLEPGIDPKYYEGLLDRKSRRAIKAGSPIKPEDYG